MKKIFVILALSVLSSLSSAADFGLVLNRNYAGDNRNALGATFGQKFGAFGVEAGFERYSRNTDQDRWSLIGSYDVIKFDNFTSSPVLSIKGGGAYLNNQHGADGFAWLIGTGLDIPITKQLLWTVDYKYQLGQSRVNDFNGSTIGTGLKFRF